MSTAGQEVQAYLHGIRLNLSQFAHQVLQVLLVGLTLGMMRMVVPALGQYSVGRVGHNFNRRRQPANCTGCTAPSQPH